MNNERKSDTVKTTKINDGGPAFPNGSDGTMGMSLRDWFAGMAMQGLIARNDEGTGDLIADVPDYALQIADAMLAALENTHA